MMTARETPMSKGKKRWMAANISVNPGG